MQAGESDPSVGGPVRQLLGFHLTTQLEPDEGREPIQTDIAVGLGFRGEAPRASRRRSDPGHFAAAAIAVVNRAWLIFESAHPSGGTTAGVEEGATTTAPPGISPPLSDEFGEGLPAVVWHRRRQGMRTASPG